MKSLVADDSLIVLNKVCQRLDQIGLQSIPARNGLEAYEAFARDTVELVVTDLIMPECDGIELTRRIRVLDASVQIVVLTSAGDLRYVDRAREAGANAYLLKPLDEELFRIRVEALLDSVARTKCGYESSFGV